MRRMNISWKVGKKTIDLRKLFQISGLSVNNIDKYKIVCVKLEY